MPKTWNSCVYRIHLNCLVIRIALPENDAYLAIFFPSPPTLFKRCASFIFLRSIFYELFIKFWACFWVLFVDKTQIKNIYPSKILKAYHFEIQKKKKKQTNEQTGAFQKWNINEMTEVAIPFPMEWKTLARI